MAESAALVRLRLIGAGLFVTDAKRAERALRELEGAGTGAGRGLSGGQSGSDGARQALGEVGTLAGGAAAALGRWGRAAGVAAGLAGGAALKAGADYNRMIDGQRVAFTTMLGSAQKAEEFMRRIQGLALKSPVLDPQSTGDAARLLMAYGMSAKDTLPFVEALGNMSAATGKSIAEVMPRGAMALGQIAGKGKLQTEEMNQLAESVGLGRKAIQRELGLTRDEFNDAFKPGGEGIVDTKALPAIMRAMTRQSGGAAEMLSQTTGGRLDRLKEVMRRKLGELQRPAYDALGRLASGLADRAEKIDPAAVLRKAGRARVGFQQGFSGAPRTPMGGAGGAAQAVGGAARSALDFVRQNGPRVLAVLKGLGGDLLDALKPAQPFIVNVVLPFLKGLGGGLLAGVKGAIGVLGLLARALGWLGDKLGFLKPVFTGLGAVVGFVFGGPILKALGAVPKLGGVFTALSWPIRAANKALGAVGKAVGFLWRKLKPLRDNIRYIGSAFRGAFGGLGRFIGGVFDRVRSIISGGVDFIKGALRPLVTAFNALPGPNIPGFGGGGDAPLDPNRRGPGGALADAVANVPGDLAPQRPARGGGLGGRTGPANRSRFRDAVTTGRVSVDLGGLTVKQSDRGTWSATARHEQLLEQRR